MSNTATCARCGGPITANQRGRPRLYCSDRCKRRAWLRRQAERRAAEPQPDWARDLGIWTEAQFADWLGEQGYTSEALERALAEQAEQFRH